MAAGGAHDIARAWKILAITSFAVFASALDVSILFVAFPDIRRTFSDVSPAQLSWAINAYTIVFAALLVPAGRLADRIGRKRVFLSGVLVFAIASACAGSAPTAELLIAARVLQAVGAALLFPSSLAIVLGEFPQSMRATAVGVWGAVGALAAAAGPSLGALIIEAASWRWAFYINLPIGALTVLLGLRMLRDSRDAEASPRPDVVGVPLLIAGVGALALGIVQSSEWGWLDGRTLAAFAAAALILPLFLLRSATHHSPTLDLALFKSHNYRAANLATIIFGAVFFAMFFSNIIFLTGVWGYSTLEGGLLITPGPVLAGIIAGPAGRIADRAGHRPIMVPGGLIFAAGSAWRLIEIDVQRELFTIWFPSLLLTGIGVGLVLPALSSAAVHSLPPNRFAAGSAVNQTIRQIGAVLGVAITIAILSSTDAAGLLNDYRTVFIMLAGGGVLTALVSATINTRPQPHALPVPEPPEPEPAAVPRPSGGTP
jgi:EmrB/QacA subfamily drug resistance transporter